MKMDLNELKTTITENEKTNILDTFKILLQEKANILKDERAVCVQETINQACFISLGLCGVADGIFFPNAQFNFKNTRRKFCCLCIYKNKAAVCFTHEKIENRYFLEYLDNIIYSPNEIETRKNLLFYHEIVADNIKLLKSIQQVKKSDGSNYKILCKNFISSLSNFKMAIDYNAVYISAVDQFSNSSIYHSHRILITNYHNIKDPLNPDNIMLVINQYINNYSEQLKQIEKKLKCLHSEALEIENLFNKLLTAGDKFVNKELLRDYIESNLYKL